MISRNPSFKVAPIVAALMLANSMVHAQTSSGKIEEVTVTAEKREESLQSTPIAISALSGAELKNKGITSFEGIAQNSPSINFTPYPSSSNTLILFMRGQGVADPQQITQDGSVGLYVDGVYIARPQATTFDLADVERVEVLRGPQGTLYGRNTTGGAVNIISKKPSGEFGFKEDVTYGSYNKVRSLTTIDLPKAGDFSAKVSYLYSKKDGNVDNSGGKDFNYEAQNAGRLAVRWEASKDVTADYSLELGRLDSTPIYYQNPQLNGINVACDSLLQGTSSCSVPGYTYYAKDNRMTKTYRPIDLQQSDAEYQSHILTVAWDVSSDLTLKSLTGYRDLHSDAFQDYAEVFFVPFRTYDKVESHQFSQEFQAIGNVGERIKYVSGLYYFNESASHFEHLGSATLPAAYGGLPYLKDRDVSAEAKSLAAYGQATYTPAILDDRLDVTLGARFTRDKRSADRSLSSNFVPTPALQGNSKTYSRFNPALTLGYRFTDDINGYAKVSTGYKAGGSGESVDDFTQTFKPESVTNYELGLKSYFLDRRIRANLAAFYTKISDLQMAFPTDPADPSKVLALNAGRATIKGIEAELLFLPIDDLSLSLDYAGLYAGINKVDPGAGTIFSAPAVPNATPYFRVSNSPKHKVTVAADYTLYRFTGGDVSAHVDYRWTAKYYGTQPTGVALPGTDYYRYSSYGVTDARLNLALDKNWRFGLWGKNVFNKQYKSFVIGNPDPINGLIAGGYTSNEFAWADPATYGIDVSYKY